ncbi:MAG: phosphoribosylformylglycinamidine synthase subunit PurS, partial [Planctomycetes bacterium]|nr:phosphoribosylformylglycinamidine synthase subunit PurS [Planctomycetota bacterium]
MRQWRIEVSSRAGFADTRGQDVREDIQELGISTVESVHSAKVYLIEADFDADFAERVAGELLTDTVCQEYRIGRSVPPAGPMSATVIEVHL